MGLGAAPIRARRQRPGRVVSGRSIHFRRTRGALLSGQFLEREGFCRYQQRHYLFQADRAGGDCRGADVFRLPLAELPSGHSRRPARRKRRCHSDRGRHQRHRIQLQRLSEPGEPGGRGAQPGAQRAHCHLRVDRAEHGGVSVAAGCIHRRCRAGTPAGRLGRAGIQLAVRTARAGVESQLACPPALRRCLREPERHRHHVHGDHCANDLRHGAQRHRAGGIRPCSSALRDPAACDVVQPGGVLHLSVLLSRLGKARRRDLGCHHHHLPRGTDQRHGAPAYGAQPAPAAARAGFAAARADRLRTRHADAFLGALAAYRPDHAAADSADACVSLLPSQVELAQFRPPIARFLVVARLLDRDNRAFLGR